MIFQSNPKAKLAKQSTTSCCPLLIHAHNKKKKKTKIALSRSRTLIERKTLKNDENKHLLCVANLWFVCLIFLLNFHGLLGREISVLSSESVFPHCSRLLSASECAAKLTKLAALPHSGYHSVTLSLDFYCDERSGQIILIWDVFRLLFKMCRIDWINLLAARLDANSPSRQSDSHRPPCDNSPSALINDVIYE